MRSHGPTTWRPDGGGPDMAIAWSRPNLQSFRVLYWDRRNTDGKSDITIAGDTSGRPLGWRSLRCSSARLGLCLATGICRCRKHQSAGSSRLVERIDAALASRARLPLIFAEEVFYRSRFAPHCAMGCKCPSVEPLRRSIKQILPCGTRFLKWNRHQFVRQMAYCGAYL